MDITFSRFFASPDTTRNDHFPKRPQTGDVSMLSHRSEPRTEEPTILPKSVDKPSPIRQNASPQMPSAVIGPKIRFKGELVGEEDLLIEGEVEGTIDLKGQQLTVGEKGTLQANVKAKTITVEGKVKGDLFGEERIAIRSSSQVQGNIKADRVILEDGAKFRGSIDMDMDEQSDIKSLAGQLKESESVKKSTDGES